MLVSQSIWILWHHRLTSSCFVSFAGVAGTIGGVTKTNLTAATARSLLDPEDVMDVSELDASKMRKGKRLLIFSDCTM